jgi:plasmid stabilization system protein ParE
MTGYDFHPEAETDLDEIWEYIAADNEAPRTGLSRISAKHSTIW